MPPTGRYLLDTSIVVALFQGDPVIQARLAEVPEVFLPSVVLGELHYGAARSGKSDANAARVDEFAGSCTVLPIDALTARRYGQVKGQLKARGRPIPENDVWIAACALVHNLVLATRDRHFEEVEGLASEAW
ncbi:MAG TPA: type II toxin-antitoxin system VapC family toxin [Thermoanaerobaculia bacterium]|nr:type II toxin-antitoxin system VapC family toxin [Thermoanaerobaculia bacterium]